MTRKRDQVENHEEVQSASSSNAIDRKRGLSPEHARILVTRWEEELKRAKLQSTDASQEAENAAKYAAACKQRVFDLEVRIEEIQASTLS